MKTNYWNPRIQSESPGDAFTIIELVVVVAVVALLVCLQLPALARAGRESRVAQCAVNERQLALASRVYADENQDRFPTMSGGAWAWDMPAAARDSLLRYGATRNAFYCPANPDQNMDAAWSYAGGAYSITGYAFGYSQVSGLNSTNWNAMTIPLTIPGGPISYSPPSASKRVLLADAVISSFGQNNSALRNSYQYSGIAGGLGGPTGPFQHRTSHLNNSFPAGGNVAMLDAHVEWRPFSLMLPRTDSVSVPCFWW